jgi:UDP-N-acetylglucosamine 1-carboxyvinyltransferase
MSKFLITGGKTLSGDIHVSGAKNFALKVLPAALMLEGPTTFTRVPNIEDIRRTIELLKGLGVTVAQDGATVTVDPSTLSTSVLNPQAHQKVRTSFLLAGPVLVKKGEIDFPYPGGCVIGKRPIDFILDGFKTLGVDIQDRPDGYKLVVKKLRGAKFVFPRVSVTGTEALMTFAARIPGTTTLVNAAMEPEIPALAEFLNSCGAKISGAGTPTIIIEGVDKLSGGSCEIIPDRIEAGTFAIMAATTKSHIKVTGINPGHLETLWEILKKAGAKFELGTDFVEVFPTKALIAVPKDIVTHEYPGLATDLQAPLTVLMTQAQGNSLIFETIYEGRLFYIDSLNSMGANILMCDPHRALVSGPTKLFARKLASPDIRAGIALVIAGLIADGETEIDNIYQVDRGYENIEQRLRALGADIKRIE